jgi:PmbA protein
MSDLLSLVVGIAERARSDEQLEAFSVHEREFQVKAYDGEVESLSSAEPRGVGIRILKGSRIGFAYTTDVSDQGIEDAVAQARENSVHATADDAVALASAWSHRPEDVPGIFDPSQPAVPPEDKVAFALELERATRTSDGRIRAVEESVYADSDAEVAIATSTGVAGAYRSTSAWCYSVAIAEDDGDTQVGFDFELAGGIGALDAGDVATRAAGKALGVLGAKKIPSERMPVVFDPYVAGQFLGVLGSALTAEAVQKGRSLFAGRIGAQVAAEGLSLVDDGRVEAAPGSAPWDGEGVPTQRTEVIRSGLLASFLYDTTSARRERRSSTGNAARAGFKSTPQPSPTNLAFAPTGESRAEVLRRAGRAFLVQDFHGVHSGANPISGDFSVGATGRIVEGGEEGPPVKEVTIAAPMLEILKSIVAVADDRRWLPFGGSYGGATTLVAEMTVAGS